MHRSQVEYALTLLARTSGGTGERARRAEQELVGWRRAAPEHESAFQEAWRRWQALDAMSSELRGLIAEPRTRLRRLRNWRLPVFGTAFAGLLLACAGWYYLVPLETQVFATALAQSGRYELSDGSTLELNADSRVQVRYFRHRREAELLAGEARFHVQPQAGQPFSVTGGGVRATVLGTVFSVGHRGAGAQVQVEEGVVRVDALRAWWHPDLTGPVLHAGQQIYGDRQALGAVQALPETQAAAWRRGLAVFDDTTLAEALAQLQPWSAVPLRLMDERAGQQRITGTFHLDDVAGVIALLPRIAAVQVEQRADGVQIRSLAAR
ncbi:FecR family protein [Kerstersia sp.]|uniref:FecR family protein n=1 Tax=Kerstersia sp. TaxID=1930783 RepID=UPI003F92780E